MKRFLMMMTLIGLVGNWNSTLTAQLVSPDSLYLNEDLPEINIVAVKPLIKAEADKTTYSIAEDPDSRTYTLLEMLRKVPLVTVDGEDNVKVNGQSSFKIYMNGRPSNMFSNNPKEVLRSIPASMIKKVEVITDPGARYDAEGVSGILNIVTKGAEFEGYNASINTTVMNLFKSAGGFATLKYGRLSLSGNYTFSQQSVRERVGLSPYPVGRRCEAPDALGRRREISGPLWKSGRQFRDRYIEFDLLVRKLEYRKQQLYLE